MRCKCPHCRGARCAKCDYTGFMPVSFAKGKTYTRACKNPECLFENGIHIVEAGKKLPKDSESCVRCKSETEWKEVGVSV